jgi:hypothetical protein
MKPIDAPMLVLIVVLGGALYFLPTIVRELRGVKHHAGIFVLNLLLGWTLLGWVAALVWAFQAKTPSQAWPSAAPVVPVCPRCKAPLNYGQTTCWCGLSITWR